MGDKEMVRMNILAIDPATQCGWALKKGDKITSGSKSFKHGEFDGSGYAYTNFYNWLLGFKEVDLLVFEGVHSHTGTIAAHKYGGFISQITKYAYGNKIPHTAWPPTVIKKHWTGKGNAKKDDMMEEAFNRGFNPVDDNEADALAILSLAEEQFKDLLNQP